MQWGANSDLNLYVVVIAPYIVPNSVMKTQPKYPCLLLSVTVSVHNWSKDGDGMKMVFIFPHNTPSSSYLLQVDGGKPKVNINLYWNNCFVCCVKFFHVTQIINSKHMHIQQCKTQIRRLCSQIQCFKTDDFVHFTSRLLDAVFFKRSDSNRRLQKYAAGGWLNPLSVKQSIFTATVMGTVSRNGLFVSTLLVY